MPDKPNFHTDTNKCLIKQFYKRDYDACEYPNTPEFDCDNCYLQYIVKLSLAQDATSRLKHSPDQSSS